ncbi:MAG: hypothetical protein ACI9OJ_000734 [Myxococcota bacterium]|jgi:hypothetical protein
MNRSFLTIAFGMTTILAFSPLASAHFVLMDPPSYADQNFLGDPQKQPPCGQGATIIGPTGLTATYKAGSTISITIGEKIYHPGHYRVAIAQDPSLLPEPPPVTVGTTDCGATIIDANPVLPVLGDGLLLHDSPFSSDQVMEVTLPDDFVCENCTLQVIQFMAEHGLNNPGGCFYHHCAVISVVADEPVAPDAGPVVEDAGSIGDDAGPIDPDVSSGGTDTTRVPVTGDTGAADAATGTADTASTGGSSGGCSQTRRDSNPAPLAVLLFAMYALIRSRRAPRRAAQSTKR